MLVDYSVPTPGVVKNGLDFQSDRLWFSDPTSVKGKAKQLQLPHSQILCKTFLFKTFIIQFNLQNGYGDIESLNYN